MNMPPAIRERLRTVYGLDAATLGEAMLCSAWQRRVEASGVGSPNSYEALLSRSPEEFASFAEELFVPESWFFRDGGPFVFLESWVRDQWRPAAAGRILRVLSVPCAGGQEPYSIAMTLLDAGLRAGQFRVEAGDVSTRALAQAREAAYSDSSFRGTVADGRQHHFEQAGPGLRRVRVPARMPVRFQQCNLIDRDFLKKEEPFEVIFCRNVLIYFDAEARRRVLATLRRCLAPGGLLFSGHAEGVLLLNDGFVSAGPPGAFAFRLQAADATAPQPNADN